MGLRVFQQDKIYAFITTQTKTSPCLLLSDPTPEFPHHLYVPVKISVMRMSEVFRAIGKLLYHWLVAS